MSDWLIGFGFQTHREAVYFGMGLFCGAAPFVIFILMKWCIRIEMDIQYYERLLAELDRLHQ